jgi:hypothetical protein
MLPLHPTCSPPACPPRCSRPNLCGLVRIISTYSYLLVLISTNQRLPVCHHAAPRAPAFFRALSLATSVSLVSKCTWCRPAPLQSAFVALGLTTQVSAAHSTQGQNQRRTSTIRIDRETPARGDSMQHGRTNPCKN